MGELLKYGGSGMVDLLEQLFSVIWQEEIVPRQWRDGLINPRRACARVTVLVLSVCLSVCVCVFPILVPRAIRRTNSSISDFSAIRA